jgi:hypothetical protein
MKYLQHGAVIMFVGYSAWLVGQHFTDSKIVGPIGKTIFIINLTSTVAYAAWWGIAKVLVS